MCIFGFMFAQLSGQVVRSVWPSRFTVEEVLCRGEEQDEDEQQWEEGGSEEIGEEAEWGEERQFVL